MGGGGGNRRAGGGARELNDGWEPWKTQGMNLTLGPTGVTLIGEEGARPAPQPGEAGGWEERGQPRLGREGAGRGRRWAGS